MATFRYEAFNDRGEVKCGVIEAANDTSAGTLLREMGLFVQRVELNSSEPMKTILPGAAEMAYALAPSEAPPIVGLDGREMGITGPPGAKGTTPMLQAGQTGIPAKAKPVSPMDALEKEQVAIRAFYSSAASKFKKKDKSEWGELQREALDETAKALLKRAYIAAFDQIEF